ncbi:MAG: hypothetical protein MR591_02215 [Helicobacter sp.]|uniref:hypothetical protein n=1 Tax=unclassified Helicobacter TaxID=2593540 RepID=UPI000BABC9DF|nr:hypothetical protein [Helicobacter sp. TUL]MCI6312596.1 hypothetical protein [Helicobacter sp.]PAU99583.1 hypothetical protein B9T66_06535 [Helicobacter sp. TUL]
MASNIASAAMWAAVFTPTADEIAKEIVAEEARLREIEEKAYWEAYWKAWDRAVKEGVIERLRNHEEGFKFFPKTYPNMTQDEQADLIEKGELQIVAPLQNPTGFILIWADETREETKHPLYQQGLSVVKQYLANKTHRVIV